MALTPEQKQVTFHEETGHSGILPSGEGNYYDPTQVLRNDNTWEGNDASKILKGDQHAHPNNPDYGLTSSVTPRELSFTNVGPSGTVSNQNVANGASLGALNNPISNATNYPPQFGTQGPYIHYSVPLASPLLPDNDGAIRYYPTTNITATTSSYYPYGMSPTKYISASVRELPSPTGDYNSSSMGGF